MDIVVGQDGVGRGAHRGIRGGSGAGRAAGGLGRVEVGIHRGDGRVPGIRARGCRLVVGAHPTRTAVCVPPTVLGLRADVDDTVRRRGGGVEEVTVGAGGLGELGAGAGLDDPAGGEDGHEIGAGDRRETVRDEDAGAAAEQAVGRGDDACLRERIHAGGGLVEDDDLHVAHEQPGEGEQLFLAGRQRRAARAEEGVEAVLQPGHPVGEAEFVDDGLDAVGGDLGEQGDVLSEGAGEDLGALGDDADGVPQGLEVEVEDVGAAEEDVAAARFDGAGHERGEGRLARPGPSHEGEGGTGGHGEVDVLEGERALGVGEGHVAKLEPHGPVGQ